MEKTHLVHPQLDALTRRVRALVGLGEKRKIVSIEAWAACPNAWSMLAKPPSSRSTRAPREHQQKECTTEVGIY